MTYTCEECGETKTEEIQESETHTYVWSYGNEQNHKGMCACGDTVTAPHTWNAGEVMNGVKLHTCTTCGTTKMEAIEASNTSTGGCKGAVSGKLAVMLLAMAGLACALTLKKKKK